MNGAESARPHDRVLAGTPAEAGKYTSLADAPLLRCGVGSVVAPSAVFGGREENTQQQGKHNSRSFVTSSSDEQNRSLPAVHLKGHPAKAPGWPFDQLTA
jgi:hypothetical protein